MNQILRLADALGCETRLHLLRLLATGDLIVTVAAMQLGLAPSTVSRHLAVLARVGLVRGVRDGRVHVYRLRRRRITIVFEDHAPTHSS